MFKSLPVQLVLCVVIGLLLGDYLNDHTISIFYTVSCLLKEILMQILPFIIIGYIFAAMLSFEEQAPWLILGLVIFVVLSNGLSVLAAYGVGQFVLPKLSLGTLHSFSGNQVKIQQLWSFNLASVLSSDRAMLVGVMLGVFSSFVHHKALSKVLQKIAFTLRDWATIALKKGFIPFIPLYVLGFILKLDRDGDLGVLIQNYGQVFITSCCLIVIYITFLYAIAANFNIKRTFGYIREMLPAGFTAFTTMSSAAAMPVTLEATEKNLGKRDYADFAIPTTVNIHLIGDGLNIALTALALVLMMGNTIPDFITYFWFVIYYCIAKFSCTGVPGGGVLVILPVAQHYLGLAPEATAMLATIYILQDPILSAANVMGNGAFALLTAKIFGKTTT